MEGEEPQIINSLGSVRHSGKSTSDMDTPRQSFCNCWYCTHTCGALGKDE